jgi:hypothetical protein
MAVYSHPYGHTAYRVCWKYSWCKHTHLHPHLWFPGANIIPMDTKSGRLLAGGAGAMNFLLYSDSRVVFSSTLRNRIHQPCHVTESGKELVYSASGSMVLDWCNPYSQYVLFSKLWAVHCTVAHIISCWSSKLEGRPWTFVCNHRHQSYLTSELLPMPVTESNIGVFLNPNHATNILK